MSLSDGTYTYTKKILLFKVQSEHTGNKGDVGAENCCVGGGAHPQGRCGKNLSRKYILRIKNKNKNSEENSFSIFLIQYIFRITTI